MIEMLPVIGIGVAVLVLVGAVFAWQAKQTAELKATVEERGWAYEKGHGVVKYRVTGVHDGVPFELEMRRSRSSGNSGGSSSSTVWMTPAEPTDAVVLVGPKLPAALAQMNFGGGLVQMIARMILGDDAKDLAGAREVHVGSEGFREQFTVIASSEDLAAQIVVPPLEEALLGSPLAKPVVLRWRQRLQVRLTEGLRKPDQVVALVELGTVVAKRCGYA